MAEHRVRDGPPLGLSYHMPADPILLAIGRVAIVHGQLHDAVTMTIKTLADVTPEEARNANDGARFADLTARVRRLAFEKLGDGQALIKLDSILQRARAANKRRNDLLHSLWAAPLDGSPVTRDEGEWAPAPEVAELRDLESKMSRLVYEIHEGRLNGWLFEALRAAKEKAIKKYARARHALPLAGSRPISAACSRSDDNGAAPSNRGRGDGGAPRRQTGAPFAFQ